MSKFSQNRTTQFDEVEEPKFKKKVKEKRKSSDNTFLEDFQKPNDHWANKKKNKDKHNRNYDDYDGWNSCYSFNIIERKRSTKGNFVLVFLLFHYFLLLLLLLILLLCCYQYCYYFLGGNFFGK